MLAYFSRLRNKKAFTLVETIVVIGIIAILMAIAVPTFLSLSSQQDKSDTYAQNFYYAAQDIFSDLGINKAFDSMPSNKTGVNMTKLTTLTTTSGGTTWSPRYILYAHTQSDGSVVLVSLWEVVHLDLFYLVPTTPEGLISTSATTGVITDADHPIYTIQTQLQSKLKDVTDDGYFYAIADYRYRVYEAYWSEASLQELTTDSEGAVIDFKYENGRVNGYTIGVFPETSKDLTDGELFSAE